MLRIFHFLIFFSVLGFVCKGECQPKEVVTEVLELADIKINGDRPTDIRVLDDRFYSRVLADGSLGFGEAYMEGWWDAPNLDECMHKIISANLEKSTRPNFTMIWNYIKAKFVNMQNRNFSKLGVQMHYELGDELYENMLGDTMAYTCAYWKDAKTLDEAQKAKFDLVAKKMDLKAGMRVLDLGCGWGGFSKHIAANYGVEVVAVNLSEKQCAYAKNICKGLPVEVRNHDYRDTVGSFDRIISIGLMEHVGHKNYREFMELIHRCLKPGGLALIHTIGRNTSTSTTEPWINKYIFSHGHLPSITQIGQSLEGLFVMEDWHNFGSDYDKTLVAWFDQFDKNWSKVKANYPDPFYKMWKYYLLSCAGAFRARDIQLWQIVLSKEGVPKGYNSIR